MTFALASTPATSFSIASPFGIFASEPSDWVLVPIPIETQDDNLTVVLNPDNATATENLVTFDAGAFTENIAALSVGGTNYTLTRDRDNLESGEFYFDWNSKQVQVKLNPDQNLSKDIVSYQSEVTSLNQSTDICAANEPLLSRWNATGQITINRRFESEPTFSFEFQDCSDRKNFILSELAVGTEHNCFGYKWVVQNITIADRAYIDSIYVSVQLVHFLASRGEPSQSKLDKLLKLKSTPYRRTRNIAEFAAEAGVTYRGNNFSIRIPRQTKITETTTLRSLLRQYARTQHSFIFYAPDGIELKEWRDTRTHIINNDDLRNENVAFNYAGSGSFLNGVQLATEYRNRKLELDFNQDATIENTGVTQAWTFVNCTDLVDLNQPTREINGVLRQPSEEELRSPLVNFDVSGAFTKSAKLTYYYNGSPTFEIYKQTGYAFATSDPDIYNIAISAQGGITISLNSTANPQAHWMEVRSHNTDWVYNSEGYLTAVRINGMEKARLQQETENLEAVFLKAQAFANATDVNGITQPDPSLLAQSQAYEFDRNLPIIDETTYTLNLHRNSFEGVVEPEDCDDPDFIEPKFVRLMQRYKENSFVAENPKNTEDFTYPPIVSGSYYQETQTLRVTSDRTPEKYEITSRTASSQGENFKNSATESNTEYHSGQPSVQQRIDLTLDYQSPLLTQDRTNWENYRYDRFYLFSAGVTGLETKTNEGTISYPDIDNPNTAVAIAETELSITNTQNSLTTELDIFYRNGIEEGDFILFRGRRWKILSVTDARTLEVDRMKSDRLILSLGAYLDPRLERENRRCN